MLVAVDGCDDEVVDFGSLGNFASLLLRRLPTSRLLFSFILPGVGASERRDAHRMESISCRRLVSCRVCHCTSPGTERYWEAKTFHLPPKDHCEA